MSTDRSNSPSSTSPSNHYRRASLTPGASFTELFSKHKGHGANMINPAGSPPFPSPITTAAANASNQRRRLSITTLGLSGSPTQTSPFGNPAMRRESLSSSVASSSVSLEEAVDDVENTPPNSQASPFARRVSFGAQALREVRGGSGTGNGEGFNWSEALRTRAERAPSLAGVFSTSPQGQQPSAASPRAHHQRAASIAIMEQPTREMPKEPKQNKPDFFQEKILRADFMD
ncbi:hypothetical protein VTN77DRAFT_1677 [Rasamsonia byssochlamydoides]|uniref:uncharacterized protein n=1 Tax=Rasamsonia byssochlamydoides TaxID=89139 RepID=UPI003742DF9D